MQAELVNIIGVILDKKLAEKELILKVLELSSTIMFLKRSI